MVICYKSGKGKVAKGEGWATLFYCGSLNPTTPTASKLLETFTFTGDTPYVVIIFSVKQVDLKHFRP